MPHSLIEMHIGISTDSTGNGSWVASLESSDTRIEFDGTDSFTTADRVALLAAITGLGALKRRSAVELYTDAPYLAHGAVRWLPIWKSVMAGKRADGRDKIRNHDRWGELHAVASLHDIHWHFIDTRLKQKSGIVGRTPGEGADLAHLYCGAVPSWDKSLGAYRAFTEAEMQDEIVCYRIDDDEAPTDSATPSTPTPDTRLALIARAAQQKTITSHDTRSTKDRYRSAA